jgi:hypothetical protein
MVEPIMFAGIGFLTACLIMLTLFPLVHERAVRLTTRRLTAATPLSLVEMQAEKDLLRAQFAMSMRRLEISASEAKTKAVDQLCEVGKKMAEVHGLKAELTKAAEHVRALREQERKRRSVTKRVVKLLLYLVTRARRDDEPVSAPAAAAQPPTEDWEALLTRFRRSLQNSGIAQSAT